MKKTITTLIMFVVCASVFSGEVGLPTEHLALPAVQAGGEYQVCIWDETAGNWLQAHVDYAHEGSFDFQVPAWSQWYWIGLWDVDNEKYVFGKWIGHFKTS